jgi:MGT family glycosyltransferase
VRFLFVCLPLTGHVNPMQAVAAALAGRGHDVAWVGSESFLRPLVGDTVTIHPVPLRLHRGQGDLGWTAVKSRWDGYVVPHARYTLPAIDRVVTGYRPDVLVVDQHAVAGALAAHRHGLPWASMAPTAMELTRPYRAVPKVESWIHGHLAGMWSAAGLPGEPPHDLRFSPYLVVAFTVHALTCAADLPDHAHLVGAVLGPRAPVDGFPPGMVDARLLVTMGTLSMDIARDFYRRMVEALRPLDEGAVVVAPDGTVANPPEQVRVFARVPVLDLLPHLDAVVSHGGLNTVCEALAHGVPLIVAPIRNDQPVNAAQVTSAGAGIRVSFARARPEQLRDAVRTVLDDPAYRAGAARVRNAMTEAGGAPAAAGLLERLALTGRPL